MIPDPCVSPRAQFPERFALLNSPQCRRSADTVETLVGIPVLAYGVDEMVRGRRSCRQVAWQLSGKVVPCGQ
jgi:hypothetical protein